MELDTKGVPKESRSQKVSKINANNGNEKRSGKSSTIMFLLILKSFKFIVNTSVFDSLEGCAREGYMYQKNIKNETNIHFKNDKNQYKNRAPKKDTNNNKTQPKSNPKGS